MLQAESYFPASPASSAFATARPTINPNAPFVANPSTLPAATEPQAYTFAMAEPAAFSSRPSASVRTPPRIL